MEAGKTCRTYRKHMALQKNPSQFFCVDPSLLREGEAITFDLYIYLPLNQRIVLIKKPGDVIDSGFSHKYITRGLKVFYVTVKQRPEYEAYLKKAEAQAKPKEVGEPTTAFKPDSTQTAPPPEVTVTPEIDTQIKEAFKDLDNPDEKKREEAVRKCREVVEDMVMLAENAESLFSELWDAAHAEAQHAINVATFSVLFSLGMGHNNRDLLKEMALAGLLHDIGMAQVDGDAVRTPTLKRNETQMKYFEDHVKSTIQMIAALSLQLTPRTLQLITQHHEKFDGTGYPKHIKNWDVPEMSQILSMADICDNMVNGHYDGVKRGITEAFATIAVIETSKVFPQYYNPDYFKKLVAWVQSGTNKELTDEAGNILTETLSGTLKPPAAA